MADPSSQLSLFEAEATHLSWQKVITPAALDAVAQDRGQLVEFLGDRALFALGHYFLSWRLLHDEPVVLVDGANIINLALILRLTHDLNPDRRKMLDQIHLSRAFTIHQLEAVIGDRLEPAMRKYQSRVCFISGLLDTFYDEEVPMWEATRILRRVMEKLRALADLGYRVIVLASDPTSNTTRKRSLLPLVTKGADRIFALVNENGQQILIDRTEATGDQRWHLPSFRFTIKGQPAR